MSKTTKPWDNDIQLAVAGIADTSRRYADPLEFIRHVVAALQQGLDRWKAHLAEENNDATGL